MSEDTKTLGVNVNGVTVKKLTAFNAAFIRDNKIGPGARLLITRQGEAIPYIKEVLKPSPTGPQFPDKNIVGPYAWNPSRIDLVLDKDHKGDELQIQQLIRFFDAVGAEFFSEQTIRKFYAGGFTTVRGVLTVSDKQMQELGGFKERAIERTRQVFRKLTDPGITLPTYLYASGAFGRGLGKDKLQRIFEEFGEDCIWGWDGLTLRDIASNVESIHGFSFETGSQFAKGIRAFLNFYKDTKDFIKISKPKVATGSKLVGKVAYLTSFRNPEIADFIRDQGGRVASSFGNSVNLLLVKNEGTNNDKTKRARLRGTQIMTEGEFKTKYLQTSQLI